MSGYAKRRRRDRGGSDSACILLRGSVVTDTAAMLFVLVAGFMAMLALVKFAQRIIDRPEEAKRRSQLAETVSPPASS